MDGSAGLGERYGAPLFSTPLIPILAFAAGLPCLGAARAARAAFAEQVKGEGNFSRVAEASMTIDAAELMMRDVLSRMMTQRNEASVEERGSWNSQVAHAVFMCREATNSFASLIGASGAMLDNPIQRFARDINTAANHLIFERESRYGDHARQLIGQPITNRLN